MRTLLPLILTITLVLSLPQGAPLSVCQTMTVVHGGRIPSQEGISPYTIVPKMQGGTVLVTVTSTLGVPFQGFLLQGRTPNQEILGQFDSSSINEGHPINCREPADSITHNSPKDKSSIDVVWRPPRGYEGPIVFNATLAQAYDIFWLGVESHPVEISKREAKDPQFVAPSQPNAPTPPNYIPQRPQQNSAKFDPFYEGCSVTKLCFGAPVNCVNSKNCKAVVAVAVAGDRYDFELKAESRAVWVGVGLSNDDKMGNDSVIECVKQENGIASYMSHTIGSIENPNYGAPRLPNPQLGILLLNSSVVDGALYCKVRRDVRTNVNGRTFDLIGGKYNILVAAGSKLRANSIGFHNIVYRASAKSQALADVLALTAKSKLLIRIHGSFMLAAWLGTAPIGILLARYYRQTWVGNQLFGKNMWFAWHRTFMILTWCLTIVAFILIFVELKAWSGENNPHAILGTITTILCFMQLIGAYFRPDPGTSRRPIFNWLHWALGNAAHIIAIVTLFFAVKLTKAELPEFFDWVLVAYVVFYVITHLVLSILNCVAEKSAESRVYSFPVKDMSGTGRSSAYADRGEDAPYTSFRKALLAIYIVIIIAIVVASIMLTALAPIRI